jgi:hypothetical protein
VKKFGFANCALSQDSPTKSLGTSAADLGTLKVKDALASVDSERETPRGEAIALTARHVMNFLRSTDYSSLGSILAEFKEKRHSAPYIHGNTQDGHNAKRRLLHIKRGELGPSDMLFAGERLWTLV